MILRFLLASFFMVFSAQAAETYDQLLNEGLKAEGLRQNAEAISFYIKAAAANPRATLPKERIISIFRDLKERNEPTTELEILLPEDLKRDLSQIGVLRTTQDDAASLRTMNLIFWSVAGLVVVGLLGGLFVLFLRSRREDDAPKFSTKKTPKRMVPVQSTAIKKEVKVTQKTKEQMSGIIASVKSLGAPEATTPATPEKQAEEIKALQDSEVLQALAETMISEVSVEETKDGKFSKLSLEASLIFDEKEKIE